MQLATALHHWPGLHHPAGPPAQLTASEGMSEGGEEGHYIHLTDIACEAPEELFHFRGSVSMGGARWPAMATGEDGGTWALCRSHRHHPDGESAAGLCSNPPTRRGRNVQMVLVMFFSTGIKL